jgi:hypothetical protein
MAKRRPKRTNPDHEQQLGITINPFTLLPETTVEPRTAPVNEKPRRPWGRKPK